VVDEKTGKKVMQDQEKVILDNLKGRLKPGTFTAILGPSGSGKTTLLNLLSGRLASNNMKIYGEMYLNKKLVPDTEKYSNYMAYVMQDDILFQSFTPREALTFAARLKLGGTQSF
jgi:ABC-type multidrug transport system ATPase subunit